MLTCKQISELISQSLDRPLPLGKRMSVWMHLKMCRLCAAFRRDQVLFQSSLSRELEQVAKYEKDPTVRLPDDAKRRIAKAMQSNG
ncbi:hypothetical protein K227x_39330 [Rubripirellula lacrimiformis]|uniref:Zinc-finger domain-containing protein n=1 Tax=Rubripirellula lacrimiformis TaxID=1930273 RepID=A0A517NEH9_9BACT|nr:zf-HC2 domain-containing protein [Rubripirellula lacrimiformis]QDT05533.1 hypothetical protein K227x_39330 [Rubripirellula lacrimiformis]